MPEYDIEMCIRDRTYLVWGGLHGVCQAVENHLPHRRSGKLRHALRVLGTFCILAGLFMIFRASSLGLSLIHI